MQRDGGPTFVKFPRDHMESGAFLSRQHPLWFQHSPAEMYSCNPHQSFAIFKQHMPVFGFRLNCPVLQQPVFALSRAVLQGRYSTDFQTE